MASLTPQALIFAAVAGFIGLALVVFKFKGAMLVYGGMILASALAAPADWLGRPIQTWLLPIQTRRSEIFAAGGALLLAGMVFHLPQVRLNRLSAMGLLFVLIGFYGAFVRAVGGDLTAGAESAAFAFLTLVPAVLILPSLFQSRDDALNMLRIVGLIAAAWIGACLVQFVIRHKVLTVGGGYVRFNGMLANPQHAAAFLSFCICTLTFLMLNDPKARYRLFWAALAAVCTVLVMWTGSRTGVGMTTIGLIAVLYSRLGRSILLLPIAGLVLAGALSFVQETTTIDFSRLTSTQDTRTRAWLVLWEEFLARPMFGTAMSEKTQFTENSLLMALAGFGIGMGLLVFTLILVMLGKSWTVFRARFTLQDDVEKRLADVFVGFMGMYLFGAMFEGYMVSRVSAPMAFAMLAMGMGTWIEHRARELRHEEDFGPDPREWDEDSDFSRYEDYGSETGSAPALTDSRTA
jgi:hypothetical protein